MEYKALSIIVGLLLMTYSSYQLINKETYIEWVKKEISDSYYEIDFNEYLGIRVVLFALGAVAFNVPFIIFILNSPHIFNVLALVFSTGYTSFVWMYFRKMGKYFKKEIKMAQYLGS